MKNLQFFYCAAFLLTVVNTLNHDTNNLQLVPHVKSTEKQIGKFLLEIAENLKSEPVDSNRVRVKRSIMVYGKCATGETWLLNRCVSCNAYEEYTGNVGKGC